MTGLAGEESCRVASRKEATCRIKEAEAGMDNLQGEDEALADLLVMPHGERSGRCPGRQDDAPAAEIDEVPAAAEDEGAILDDHVRVMPTPHPTCSSIPVGPQNRLQESMTPRKAPPAGVEPGPDRPPLPLSSVTDTTAGMPASGAVGSGPPISRRACASSQPARVISLPPPCPRRRRRSRRPGAWRSAGHGSRQCRPVPLGEERAKAQVAVGTIAHPVGGHRLASWPSLSAKMWSECVKFRDAKLETSWSQRAARWQQPFPPPCGEGQGGGIAEHPRIGSPPHP